MRLNHFFSSPGLVEDTRNLHVLNIFLTKIKSTYGLRETWDQHHWMPVKYRDLISVPHLGSPTPPCWATRCTSSRRTWPTTAGCKTRRFSAVLTPDIIPEWPKWSVLANVDSEAGVPREQEHGGPLHVPQEGHQHSQIHSHIKVSVEYGLNHVFMDIQGVPKKRPHVLNGHNSYKDGTRNKSRVSFGICM